MVVFALEWCEFCWSVRKLFEHCAIEYRAILLDSVEFQHQQRGRQVRDALALRTSSLTIPQIFIGGEFIGGCTEVFESLGDGSLVRRLNAAGVACHIPDGVDPYTFLPGWLHPR